ncbi:uncharacterized protein LOC123430118 [Hordeum vulgare subsp. vulgare]|uniref:uncharacterized protein LOC123430118 n=1 Tax=Hordeum vulgare subsp. vulgare TaxID=112509 RepID=UPI00162F16BF|nr:uncharacterized protein LOC123430118 [Hordeum vulgare subsp. vulgare]
MVLMFLGMELILLQDMNMNMCMRKKNLTRWWYVLNNCDQAKKYIDMFIDELKRKRLPDSDKELQQIFQTWFRNYDEGVEEVDEDLFALACGPDRRVRKFPSCIVNGIRFSTVDHDSNKRTQNSGVMTEGEHDCKIIDFYGTLKEIIQLDYNLEDRSVVLFKCDWFKLDGKKTELKNDGFFKSIHVGSWWYKDDSLILATQASKVVYLPDTKYGKNWQVVQTFDHRHLFNISETEGVPFSGPAYQEEECCEKEGRRTSVSDLTSEKPLHRHDEQGIIFEADVVAHLMKEKTTKVYEGGNEDEEDDTGLEYCSENEEGATMDVDSDDE